MVVLAIVTSGVPSRLWPKCELRVSVLAGWLLGLSRRFSIPWRLSRKKPTFTVTCYRSEVRVVLMLVLSLATRLAIIMCWSSVLR